MAQVSAEIRWFWPAAPPPGLDAWFFSDQAHGCAAGGPTSRIDEYLLLADESLGLKRRGGKDGVELKGRIAVADAALQASPFAGAVEIWAKWSSAWLDSSSGSTLAVEKRRWLRKFDTGDAVPREISLGPDESPRDGGLPTRGCNVELTEVKCGGSVWWTLGFEAFGTIHTVENALREGANVMRDRRPPRFEGAPASYPSWLQARRR